MNTVSVDAQETITRMLNQTLRFSNFVHFQKAKKQTVLEMDIDIYGNTMQVV